MTTLRLRVATYNIHKGVSAFGRRSRVAELRMALHRIGADLVFLQEVQERNERLAQRLSLDTQSTQLDVLASSGYPHRAYGVNAVYAHGHHGNAILSRLPIERYANHDISDHLLEQRGVLHAVAALPGRRRLHLLCAHLGLAQRSRLRQAQWVADFVRREIPAGEPLLLAGDFNDWQHRVDQRLREELGVRDVSESMPVRGWLERLLPWRKPPPVSRTFPSIAPTLALDRIYVRGLRARAVQVPRGRIWARCSDHAPLIADLEF